MFFLVLFVLFFEVVLCGFFEVVFWFLEGEVVIEFIFLLEFDFFFKFVVDDVFWFRIDLRLKFKKLLNILNGFILFFLFYIIYNCNIYN